MARWMAPFVKPSPPMSPYRQAPTPVQAARCTDHAPVVVLVVLALLVLLSVSRRMRPLEPAETAGIWSIFEDR
jgi:hypothetical protein